MSVSRLSSTALQKILNGEIKEDATCVIKFYSNGCHLCHNLKDYYEDLSNNKEYEDIHFFAFNVDNSPDVEKRLRFNGVPTISVIKTTAGNDQPRVRILKDPTNPNEHTWYRVADIRRFIKENK
ncbi:MAG: thioredoxin family protein [Candidatus Thermoplasmatota archaeon]|nr:thioredoxin family protein [Candidatus Thermoplasmatota archaeon]